MCPGELRITLDLYANIRPSRSREGLPSLGPDADGLGDRSREYRGFLRGPEYVLGGRGIHANARYGARGAQDNRRKLPRGSPRRLLNSPKRGARK